MIEQKDWIDALGRIARTADGWLLYCGLHKVALGLPDDSDPSLGALSRNVGRRTLAREIMGLMAEGIDERGERTGTKQLSEQPVTFAEPKPVAVSRASFGARRRIRDGTPVPGWDTNPDRAS